MQHLCFNRTFPLVGRAAVKEHCLPVTTRGCVCLVFLLGTIGSLCSLTLHKHLYYSRFSLSRLRLSRVTVDLEVKNWCLFKHENLTTGNKILWEREEIASKRATSPLFHMFSISLASNYIFICVMKLFDLFFLNSANLICRCTDISK